MIVTNPNGQDRAKKLFFKHALFQNQPQVSEFEEVADKVIEACCGVPLMLEVLGSYLCGVPKLSVWHQALQKLQKTQCHSGSWSDEQIWTSLMISYDDLTEVEKNMFLDIACFVRYGNLGKGLQVQKALKIWNGDYANANLALLTLLGRSLVRIHADGILEMHDILCDMGVIIAGAYHPSRQRMWESSQRINDKMAPNVELYQRLLNINKSTFVTFNLPDCQGMKRFLEGLGNLTSMITLDLQYCENLGDIA